ncbi:MULTISPECIES: ScbA/BarX family gamma-butyrolactone biosynthesis protein [Prescottella]|uniref:A-factor biosynthesis protein n=1 Tax=Rhodococcus hoagii TaxID=43767 RepID=A0AAE5MJ61_RHOHA|nr:ScbA/BarX family gamma-butyrolactone biosynthesis protein [Prescottella equi]MBU4614285.1 A-factor biosynthesis protein [Rhodococcus sp. GG48]GBF15498.1 A-factor biosynthesis hotdog domain protein [Rhodococcus sp. Br-6]MBM4520152.1 A-factor biosynthesis protein [Prescottella equi]MBM4525746.1 A-factor biosynthesis protein [Prescottella equi]MBM4531537.1 A-factor biosynthesis protein [Prescottella equi]
MVQALSFESTVPRRFVHRQSVSEVYLTDGIPVGEAGRFRLGAQWPRQHAFYRTCTDRYDTMLLGETVRQCAIYLGHMHYAVPLGHLFTMQTMRIEAHLDRLTIGSSAAEVVMNAQVTEHARRGSRLSAFSVDVDFLVDDTPAGHGMAVAGVLTPDDYARIRWSSDRAPTVGRIPQPLPVLQSAVCVPDDRAVVLGVHPSGDIGRWLLRVDPTHPVLFDHPSDHVPGVVVLEAARQSARLRLGWSCADVESLELRFRRFLELDEPTTVTTELRPGEDGCVDVEFSQWGEIKASGTIRLAVPLPTVEPAHAFVGLHRV